MVSMVEAPELKAGHRADREDHPRRHPQPHRGIRVTFPLHARYRVHQVKWDGRPAGHEAGEETGEERARSRPGRRHRSGGVWASARGTRHRRMEPLRPVRTQSKAVAQGGWRPSIRGCVKWRMAPDDYQGGDINNHS